MRGEMSYLTELKSKEWKPGEWIFINKLVWGFPEIQNVLKTFEQDWMGAGEFNVLVEKKLAELVGRKYFYLVNSGSAAIELAVQTLIQTGKIKQRDNVLHPMLTFPTSISSAIMAGLNPIYIDVGRGTYNIATDKIKDTFDWNNINLAIIPALLGNIPDIDELLKYLDGRPLILDCCDTLGGTWGDKHIMGYGDIACTSFYGSHHISAFGVGGGIATDNDEYAEIIKSMIFWGRDFSETSFIKRYSYKSIGLDAQMTNVQAAFLLAQLDKLPGYIERREYVFKQLQGIFSRKLSHFILPERTSDRAWPSWFAYPITLSSIANFTRDEFVEYLQRNKIEIRPPMTLITENLPYHNPNIFLGDYPNADRAYNHGLFIPAFAMPDAQLEYYLNILRNFVKKL
jgi:CDP-6-deoxy-D-xylo-4-hexulose-3-dehydrase